LLYFVKISIILPSEKEDFHEPQTTGQCNGMGKVCNRLL